MRVYPANLEFNSNLSRGVGVTAIQDAEHILEVNSFSAPLIIQAGFPVIPAAYKSNMNISIRYE